MNINNVYQRLEAAINECGQVALEAEARKHWIKGMADGYRNALRALQEEGVVPTVDNPKETIIPFPGAKDEN